METTIHLAANGKYHPRKVLVVDDDQEMALLTQYFVECYTQARCEIATDSYEAIEAVCDNRYDYIVIDQNLPGLNGLQILKQLDSYLSSDPMLSEQDRFSTKTPVVIMSSSKVLIPEKFDLKYFEITDNINKKELSASLARNFAS